MERMNYIKLDRTKFDNFCSTLEEPSEIIKARKTYIENNYVEDGTPLSAGAVKAFVKDASFWKGYFCRQFPAEPLTNKHPQLLEDRTCKEVCKIAARYYGYLNSFKLRECASLKLSFELINDAISQGYEVVVKKYLRKIQFENLYQPFLFLSLASSHMQPNCYREILKHMLSNVRWLISVSSQRTPQQILQIQGLDMQKLNLMLGWNIDLGVVEGIRELIELGANKEMRNQFGDTFLHQAVIKGHVGVVRELIGLGADKEARDNSGNTPLHRAVLKENIEIIKALLGLEARKEARNGEGKTPYDLVEVRFLEKHPELISLLKAESYESAEIDKDSIESESSESALEQESSNIESVDYINLSREEFNSFCSDLNDPSEIFQIRTTYIKNRCEEGSTLPSAKAVKDFVRDGSFWKGYFHRLFSTEKLKVLHPHFEKSEICKEVCRLAAKFYGYPNPLKISIKMKERLWREKVHEAISSGYELTLGDLFKGIDFDNLDSAINFLNEACFHKRPKCYQVLIEHLLSDIDDFLNKENLENWQAKMTNILLMNAYNRGN